MSRARIRKKQAKRKAAAQEAAGRWWEAYEEWTRVCSAEIRELRAEMLRLMTESPK